MAIVYGIVKRHDGYVNCYSENHIHRQGIIEPGINLIQKPVSSQDLLRKVRRILDGQGLKPR